MSESILCRLYSFRILKEGSSCIITNIITSESTDIFLANGGAAGSGHYLLPVTLFAHSPRIHQINLASARPSNPLTLWHNRLGHSYTGLIQKMAKLPLYRDRGLVIPDEFIARQQEPDLCDTCALAKPTRTLIYNTQSRSDVKGKMWFFDVSCGGDLSPSLKYGNKYCFMFADSCTRMYFAYYDKKVDDASVLKILKRFASEVLSTLQREDDEFIFIRSDNGQMNSNGVRAYCRKRDIFKSIHTCIPP